MPFTSLTAFMPHGSQWFGRLPAPH